VLVRRLGRVYVIQLKQNLYANHANQLHESNRGRLHLLAPRRDCFGGAPNANRVQFTKRSSRLVERGAIAPRGTIRNKFASFAYELLFLPDAIEMNTPRRANSPRRSK